jgi:thiol-disulfide isomerase/thioredoxin
VDLAQVRRFASRLGVAASLAALVISLGAGFLEAAPRPLLPEAERLLAPDFALPDLDGNRWRLEEARGRPVLLNFAATWCPPCREELPTLARLHGRQGPDGLRVVAVFVDQAGRKAVSPLAEELALPFPVLLDPKGAVKRVFLVRALPTTVLIDPDGRVAGFLVGELPWDSPEVEDLLKGLRAGPEAERPKGVSM